MVVMVQVIDAVLVVAVISHVSHAVFLCEVSGTKVGEILKEHDVRHFWLNIKLCLKTHTLKNR